MDEFFALAMACSGIPKANTRLGGSARTGWDAIAAIHGRSGAQVALLQSPIPRTAHENYEIDLESQLKTTYITPTRVGDFDSTRGG